MTEGDPNGEPNATDTDQKNPGLVRGRGFCFWSRIQLGEIFMEALLTQHLETSPDVRGGKVCLAGTRFAVEDVVLLHLRLGKSLEEIAGTFDLPLAAVHTAMAYYYDRQEEVDRSIQEDLAFAEAFERHNVSPLREKLKALALG
jgi:uncharacterized protein (DUF433 family)